MSYFLTTSTPLTSPRTKDLGRIVSELSSFRKNTPTITTADEYNALLRKLVALLKQHSFPKTPAVTHDNEIKAILQSKPLTEKVIWGGVSLKKIDVAKNLVQKLLVINAFGILGFEIHQKKLEKLKVLEGFCLVLYSNHKKKGWEKGAVSLKLAGPDDCFTFEPHDEHGIIALTDCVIEETSTNHLDDLIYIFPSKQISN